MQIRSTFGFLAGDDRGSVAIKISRGMRRIGFIALFLKRRKRKRKITLVHAKGSGRSPSGH